MKTKRRKAVRVVLIVLGVVASGLLALTVLLLLVSSGQIKPYLDENGKPLAGSVSEKIWVSINGAEQGMFIRGKNIDNPVLLFVHGGPGMPEYFLADAQDTGLGDKFTVCYWEQRGSGLSYRNGMDMSCITVEQLVADTIGVTRYLQKRFGQEKIYLLAHSWGTFIGIQAAAQAPELYHAYIGVAQVTDMPESERRAYAWMLAQYEAAGNTGTAEKLKGYNVLETQPDTALIPYFKSMLRDNAMHELGIGTTRGMDSVVTGVFLPVMKSPVYTLGEKVNIWRAKAFLRSETGLLEQLFTTRTADIVPELSIPAYFISGAYDLTVNRDLSEDYFKQFKAPVKAFYTFADSAHSPMFEQPDRFIEVMTQDVLTGGTSLADA